MNRYFEQFLLFKADNDACADRTVRAYRDVLARFETWLAGREPLALIADDLLVFTGPYLHKALHLAPVSRVPYVACIREFYGWAAARGLAGHNPASVVPYPRTSRKLPRAATLDVAERLMWAPDFSTFEGVRDAAMLSILIGCGLRLTGLCNLNESDLISQALDGEPRLVLRPTEKGRKERMLPVPREADLLLRVYLEHPKLAAIDRQLPDGDQVLFVTTRNRRCPEHEYHGARRRFSPRGVQGMLLRHARTAGVDNAVHNPHAFRHLMGTELAEEDVDLLTRQQLFGHADPKTTAIYTQLAMRKLTRVVDQANPLGKMKTPVSALLTELGPTRKRKGR